MKIYLAGPMRGIPQFNFPAFHAAAARLRSEGHIVFSPAEKDIERHGTDITSGNEVGDEAQAARLHGFDLRVAFLEDLEWICAHADMVALLPGWHNSKGAQAERATAEALGLPIIELEAGSWKDIYADEMNSGAKLSIALAKWEGHVNAAD